MSRQNKVNPDRYKVAGRLTPDELGRELRRVNPSAPLVEGGRGRRALPFWKATAPAPPVEDRASRSRRRRKSGAETSATQAAAKSKTAKKAAKNKAATKKVASTPASKTARRTTPRSSTARSAKRPPPARSKVSASTGRARRR